MRRARIIALTFAAWTLFVWATRIVNIYRDDVMERPEKVGRVGLALTFTVLAVALLVALWRRVTPVVAALVTGLAGWTTGVWLLQSGVIFMEDYRSTGFKVVHWALAAVSIVLGAVATWATLRAQRQDERHLPGRNVPDSPAALTVPG